MVEKKFFSRGGKATVALVDSSASYNIIMTQSIKASVIGRTTLMFIV